MSILIAYKRGDTIYMGTDTRLIGDDCKFNASSKSNYNIQALENGILLGVSGETLEKQTVIANSDIFTLDKNDKLTKKHIVKDILPKLLRVLDKADMIIEKEGESIYARVIIFLAYKDVLFEVCSNFSVLQYEEFQAIGDGSEYAQGTMLNTKDADDINDRIVRALDIVSSYNYHVGRPYVLINSKDLQYKVIGG